MIIKSNIKPEEIKSLIKNSDDIIFLNKNSDADILSSFDLAVERIIRDRKKEISNVEITKNGDISIYFENYFIK